MANMPKQLILDKLNRTLSDDELMGLKARLGKRLREYEERCTDLTCRLETLQWRDNPEAPMRGGG